MKKKEHFELNAFAGKLDYSALSEMLIFLRLRGIPKYELDWATRSS
jgi:hypothetical protein